DHRTVRHGCQREPAAREQLRARGRLVLLAGVRGHDPAAQSEIAPAPVLAAGVIDPGSDTRPVPLTAYCSVAAVSHMLAPELIDAVPRFIVGWVVARLTSSAAHAKPPPGMTCPGELSVIARSPVPASAAPMSADPDSSTPELEYRPPNDPVDAPDPATL